MSDPKLQYLEVPGSDSSSRRIAYIHTPGTAAGKPGLVWLCGFNSVMTSTKASALAEWASARGLSLLRFDYSGHGASEGEFIEGTVGRWLEDSLAVLRQVANGPQILVGSSMGGWIALLILRAVAERQPMAAAIAPVAAAVLIAPAWDMTEELMWKRFPPEAREAIEREGVFQRPSRYGDGPYPITAGLIEEGRRHLIGQRPFVAGVPIRIIQGLDDPDVPWRHADALARLLAKDDVATLYIPDGDHRLARPADLDKLFQTIADLVRELAPARS